MARERKIFNKIPKEIKTINKDLKKAKIDPILIGKDALEQSFLNEENIFQLNNYQTLCGLSVIFNSKAIIRKEYLDLRKNMAIAIGYPIGLPPEAYHRYDVLNAKNGVKQKYDLMVDAIKLFDYFREKAKNTPEKTKTIRDKAHLSVQIRDFYEPYSQIASPWLTPFSLHHQALNKICCQMGFIWKNPLVDVLSLPQGSLFSFEPWLIINTHKKGYDVIYGKSQKQLIAYLLKSDYLQKYQTEFYFPLDFTLGWDSVLDRQLDLGYAVWPALLQELTKYHQSPFLQQELIEKASIFDAEITKNIEKAQAIKAQAIQEIERISEIRSEIIKEQEHIALMRTQLSLEAQEIKDTKEKVAQEKASVQFMKSQAVLEIEKANQVKKELAKEQEHIELMRQEVISDVQKTNAIKDEIAIAQQSVALIKLEALQEIEKAKELKAEIENAQKNADLMKFEALQEIESAKAIKAEIVKEQQRVELLLKEQAEKIEIINQTDLNENELKNLPLIATDPIKTEVNFAINDTKPVAVLEEAFQEQVIDSKNINSINEQINKEISEKITKTVQALSHYLALSKKAKKAKLAEYKELVHEIGRLIQSYPTHQQQIPALLVDQYIESTKNALNNAKKHERTLDGQQGKILSIIIDKFEAISFPQVLWQGYSTYFEQQIKQLMKEACAELSATEISSLINQLKQLSSKSESIADWVKQQQALMDEFSTWLEAKANNRFYSTFSRVFIILKKLFKYRQLVVVK
ncbi:MAG: hypothetical protein JSS07_06405 [Proteobacteria bacterium]|nr:hypothetical protein [Pseudomonadota bacterium]